MTKEELEAIRLLMREEVTQAVAPLRAEIAGVDARLREGLAGVNERLDVVEESLSEVRHSTNYLADWVERLEQAIPPKQLSEVK